MSIIVWYYFLFIIVLWWGYSGYIIFLYLTVLVGRTSANKDKSFEDSIDSMKLQTITIVVPVHNEERFILDKIKNLAELEYPREKLHIIFAEGSSDDNTVEIIKKEVQKYNKTKYMELIETGKIGKTNQINHVLKGIDSDIIVNTDVDGDLPSDILYQINDKFNEDKRIGVVGCPIVPMHCVEAEFDFWHVQNKMRILESRAYSSSFVIGVCYAFRNGLFPEFNEDVVADDLFVSFKAADRKFLVKYIEDTVVYEKRSPSTISKFLKHKIRKANAVHTELFRFKWSLFKPSFFWNIIYPTKLLQLVIGPIMLLLLPIVVLYLLFIGYYWLILYSGLMIVISFFVSNSILRNIFPKLDHRSNFLIGTLFVTLISNVVLVLILLMYPFYRQTSKYKKI